MNIEKEVDKFVENIKSIDEYSQEIKNNNDMLKKIVEESIEISKIKKELSQSINLLNNTSTKNTAILESNINKLEQRYIEAKQKITDVFKKNEEDNQKIRDKVNNIENKIINIKKLSLINLSCLVFVAILLILSLIIK